MTIYFEFQGNFFDYSLSGVGGWRGGISCAALDTRWDKCMYLLCTLNGNGEYYIEKFRCEHKMCMKDKKKVKKK
jgi:hypothetical protein